MTLPTAQKQSVLAGYVDCYSADVRKDNKFDQAVPNVIAAVDRYYEKRSNEHVPLATVFQRFVDGAAASFRPNAPRNLHGEIWSEKHGYYNGDYWHQLDPDQRRRFVDGYFTCRSYYLHDKITIPSAAMSQLISRWFGTSDTDESFINPEHADDSIGVVLERRLVSRRP
jgi:hypothetical protein